MATLKFVKVWRILSEYDFVSEDESVKCALCKRVMIEPTIVICGCKYCRGCITNYVGEEQKYCPGGKSDCGDEYLKMEINVLNDFATQRSIINMTVKCPGEECEVFSKLEDIEEHIRICRKRKMECPYKTVGCGSEGVREDTLNDHLHCEEVKHSQLLIEEISNLKNELNDLRGMMIEKEREMKEDREMHKKELNDLKEKLEINVRIINEFKEHSESEIKNVKEDGRRMETLIKELVGYFDQFKIIHNKEKEGFTVEKCQGTIIREKTELTKGIILVAYDFLWIFQEFSSMNVGNVDSEPFYKDNYKICIRLLTGDEKTYLWFYLHIMNGDKDEIANWPMKHTVTINIINQDSLRVHNRWSTQYDTCSDKTPFQKPEITQKQKSIYGGYIYFTDLRSMPGLLFQDSLMVCCSLTPP